MSQINLPFVSHDMDFAWASDTVRILKSSDDDYSSGYDSEDVPTDIQDGPSSNISDRDANKKIGVDYDTVEVQPEVRDPLPFSDATTEPAGCNNIAEYSPCSGTRQGTPPWVTGSYHVFNGTEYKKVDGAEVAFRISNKEKKQNIDPDETSNAHHFIYNQVECKYKISSTLTLPVLIHYNDKGRANTVQRKQVPPKPILILRFACTVYSFLLCSHWCAFRSTGYCDRV
jgi:hypothetical protein